MAVVQGLRMRTIFPFYIPKITAYQFLALAQAPTVMTKVFQKFSESQIFPIQDVNGNFVETEDLLRYVITLDQHQTKWWSELQIWLKFEVETQQVIGGFSLESWTPGQDWIQVVYFLNLVNKFIQLELNPHHPLVNLDHPDFVQTLSQMWERFVYQKFGRFQDGGNSELLTFCQHSCLDFVVCLVQLMWTTIIACERYMRGGVLTLNFPNSSPKQPFRFQMFPEIIADSEFQNTMGAIGQFVCVHEVVYEKAFSFLNYHISPQLQKYLILFLFPEVYSFAWWQPQLIVYQKLVALFQDEADVETLPEFLTAKIQQVQYANNNDYIAYINGGQILILRNETNQTWLRQAVFAKVFLQIHLDQKAEIEKQIAHHDGHGRVLKQWLFYRKMTLALNRLPFQFGGTLSTTDQILHQILQNEHYADSVKVLTRQVKTNYWFVLAAIQREYVTLAFFIASINFFVIFIMCVFTDLGAHSQYVVWKSVYIAIALATLLTVVGLSIMIWIIVRFFKARRVARELLKGV